MSGLGGRRLQPAVVLLLLVLTGQAAGQTAPLPAVGLTPQQRIGGFISIPGAPLPPISPDSVKDALKVMEPGLKVLRAVTGDTAVVARGLGFLATLHAALKNTERADELFDEAEAILRKTGSSGLDLAWLNNNRGLVRMEERRYADALQCFRWARTALPAKQPDSLEPRAVVLQNLASVSQMLDDFEGAESEYLESLEILRRLHQEKSRRYLLIRLNLAGLYTAIGDFGGARKLLEGLADSALDPYLRFCVLNDLGFVLRGLKDFPDSEKRLREAVQSAAEGSREQGLALTNLAASLSDAEHYETARQEGARALSLFEALDGPDSPSAVAVVATLGSVALATGDLATADRLLTRTKATLSRQTGNRDALAGVTHVLALVAQRKGEHQRAVELSRQALDLDEKNLHRILAFGTEGQRLAFRANTFPYDQLAELGDPELLAEAILATKGIVLESLLAERALVRASKSTADREQLERISELKVQLMERLGRGDNHVEETEEALARAETALARRLARNPLQIETPQVEQVEDSIPEGQVLIEIIRFRRLAEEGRVVPRYGAVLIPHRGKPSWVPLGPAERIDESIHTLVSRLDSAKGRGVEPIGRPSDVVPLLHELNESLWKPLEKELPPGTRGVILSPDGSTHFAPWAAFLDERDSFLVERCPMTTVDSGRDLIRRAANTSGRTLLALADGLNDLPESRTEVDAIAATASSHGWQTTILAGNDASESALFRHSHPRILHLATHGGQWREGKLEVIESRLSKQPMYRGYLLLGGAEHTLAAWKEGTVVAFSEDGILTAEEVAGLDLRGTWLTVLSSCRSGAGDAMTGEGVLGLRRGFALAGTENLLFSLWSVDDDATARFMEAFYGRLFQNGDMVRAFQETQATQLRQWRETLSLREGRGGRDAIGTAVRLAGAFVLSGSTRRNADASPEDAASPAASSH